MYRARRRRLLSGVVLALLLGYSAGQLLNDTGHVRVPAATRTDHLHPYMPAISWPLRGQAALVLGDGLPAASPNQQPVDHTTYNDPSGWDQGTVSTAADQLRVFQAVMRFAVFRETVSMPSVSLPVAGTVTTRTPAAPGPVGAPIGPAA